MMKTSVANASSAPANRRVTTKRRRRTSSDLTRGRVADCTTPFYPLGAGCLVLHALAGGGVDLVGGEQHGRLDRCPTRLADRERERGGCGVVREVGEDEHVGAAEREVERVDFSSNALRRCGG